MEQVYTGLTARVLINGTLLGYIKNVDLKLDRDVVDIEQFGSEYKEEAPGLKSWSASADGTVAFAAGGSQVKLYSAWQSGEKVTMQFKLDESVYFSGEALVSNLEISGAPSDALAITADFKGSGAVSFVLPETVSVAISSAVGGTTSPAGTIRSVKNATLTVTCVPDAGKVANKYYLNDDETGTAIVANTFTTSALAADTKIYVDWANA